MAKRERKCAYCGAGSDCRCEYRHGRMESGSFRMYNTTRQGTIAEMRQEFEKYIALYSPKAKVAWTFAFTEFDQNKIDKADAKRGEAC